MSTILQEQLAEAIVINKKLPRDKRKNKKELLVSMVYATTTAESIPNKIIDSKGVKDALKDNGLTEDLITTALVEDINAKPARRVKELSLGAEILGMKDIPQGGNRTLVINITGETANRYGIIPSQQPKDSST
mgnify:CR=1 FL=1